MIRTSSAGDSSSGTITANLVRIGSCSRFAPFDAFDAQRWCRCDTGGSGCRPGTRTRSADLHLAHWSPRSISVLDWVRGDLLHGGRVGRFQDTPRTIAHLDHVTTGSARRSCPLRVGASHEGEHCEPGKHCRSRCPGLVGHQSTECPTDGENDHDQSEHRPPGESEPACGEKVDADHENHPGHRQLGSPDHLADHQRTDWDRNDLSTDSDPVHAYFRSSIGNISVCCASHAEIYGRHDENSGDDTCTPGPGSR